MLPIPREDKAAIMVSDLPKMMKAAVIDKAGPPSAIRIACVPVPRLARGHVIIALDYASVGSWDAAMRSGAWGLVKRGTILGADGSGRIAAVAADVKRLHLGERVYSYSFGQRQGFHAEYVSVPADRVERVPTHLNQRVAGAMPCVAVTAHSGLRALKIKRGKMLLVFGASGGVGSLAVWLGAREMGAKIIGTARPDAQSYLRRLGAAHAIDPHSPRGEAEIQGIAPNGFDAILATANGQGLLAFATHLQARAPIAFPNGVEPEIHIDGHSSRPFDGDMSLKNLQLLNKAIGKRAMPLRVEMFPLDRVVDAHRRMEQGHVIGKIVLRIR